MAVEPTVTVIVPVRNDRSGLTALLACLEKQTYPASRFDVLIVANCTADDYGDLAAAYSNVSLLREDTKPNAYTARNTALREARGEVLAFTDADCRPEETWLEEGIRCLQSGGADVAGGRVRFDLPERPSAAQVLDALSYLQQEASVGVRRMAATANLFVRRTVFDSVGLFPDGYIFAGDTILCQRAVQAGFRLTYCSKATVEHPARLFGPLLQKVFRTGRGAAYRRRELPRMTGKPYHPLLALLNPLTLRRRLRTENIPRAPFWRVLCLAYLAAATAALGYVVPSYRSSVGTGSSAG
jgi:glycosyltransferase involved in cell wall biosynthesis